MNLALIMQKDRRNGNDHATSSEDMIVHALRQFPTVLDVDKADVVNDVTELLLTTSSDKVRNAAAILLTDLTGRAATEGILQLLRRPGIAKVAGTLLYALNEVEATMPLDLIIDLLEHGSLEAQGEALTFMEDARVGPVDAEQLEHASARLELLATRSDAAKVARAATLAADYLKDLRPLKT